MAKPRRVLRGALYLLGIFTVLAAFGATTPRQHVAMEIAELGAAPEVVYAAVRDVAAAPAWRSDLDRVEILPDSGERPVYREIGDDGATTYEITEDIPNERLVTEIAEPGRSFTGRWVFQFAAREDGGTRLTVTEVGDVPNPVLRFFASTIFGFDAGIRQYIGDLRTHLDRAGA